MRGFISAAFAATLFFSTASAFAQNAPPPAAHADEKVDLATVQKSVGPLASAFGVSTPAPAQSTTSAPAADEHKTLGDVADKALSDVESVTVKIAGTLEKLAPKVWEIMVRQQYAKAISGPLPSLAWIVGALVLSGIGRKNWKVICKEGEDWGDGNGGFTEAGTNDLFRFLATIAAPVVVGTAAFLFFAYQLKDSVLYAFNPDYYAIQDLIRSIMNGGQPS